jgi:uncharacterized membrane protein
MGTDGSAIAAGQPGGRAATALALALALMAAGATAQDFPLRASVTGVALTDTLNIRARPAADAAVLGTLPPTATGIEVLSLSPDGRWALVPLPEGPGWVARRFLREEPPPVGALPRPLVCRGTEPFWSLAIRGDGTVLERPGEAPLALAETGEAAGRTGFVASFALGARTGELAVLRASCSDGMSDRPYGLAALLWVRGLAADGEGETLLEGCCTLQER